MLPALPGGLLLRNSGLVALWSFKMADCGSELPSTRLEVST